MASVFVVRRKPKSTQGDLNATNEDCSQIRWQNLRSIQVRTSLLELRRLLAQHRPQSTKEACDQHTATGPYKINDVQKNQRLWLPGADRSDWAIRGRVFHLASAIRSHHHQIALVRRALDDHQAILQITKVSTEFLHGVQQVLSCFCIGVYLVSRQNEDNLT